MSSGVTAPAATLPPPDRAATWRLREPRYSQSLERGLAMLACFTAETPTLGIADMADRLNMSRSTTHRYAITLVALGYLEQGSNRKYRLGLRPQDLGMSALDANVVRPAARPYLAELHKSSGYTVGLGVLDAGEVLYLDHLASRQRGQTSGPRIRVGVRIPAHCTSIGKALLAFLSDEGREDILRGKLKRHADGTITNKKTLRTMLAEIAGQGYAISDEELWAGARSLAVPVYDGEGVVAAVNISIYRSAISVERLIEEFYPLVGGVAEKISRTLGYTIG
jgi:DNA-binding IclR family transcriptional regulator